MIGLEQVPDEIPEDETYKPAPTTGEVFSAALEKSYLSGTVMSLTRSSIVEEFKAQGKMLQPQEVENLFPNLKGKVTEPISDRAAFYLNDVHEDERKRQDILSRAQGFFDQNVVPLAGGISGAMADPVDFAVNAALGGALGKVMPTTQLPQTFAREMFSNLMGNSMTEYFNYQASQDEVMKYTVSEAFNNVVLTSAFGAGISTGVQAFKNFSRLRPEQTANITQAVDTAIDNGISAHGVMKKVFNELEQDVKVPESVQEVVQSLSPESVEKLSKLQDAFDFMKTLDEMKASGAISDEEAKSMVEAMGKELAGRKSYLFDERSKFSLDEKVNQEVVMEFQDFKNDINYAPHVEESLQAREIHGGLDETKVEASVDEELRIMEQEYKVQEEAGLIPPEKIKAIDEELSRSRPARYAEYVKNVVGCLIGGSLQ